MKTNTVTTVILAADEGCLLINKIDNTIYGRVIYCPVADVGNYEELSETEAMKKINTAVEEKERQEAEEQARLEKEEASENGDDSTTNN